MSRKYSKEQMYIKNISYQTERLVDGLVFFDFYDPTQVQMIEGYLSTTGVYYEFFGGYPLAERKMLCISKEPVDDVPWPILVCTADNDFNANHRSLLGALMGLGINRDTIGDIIVGEGEVQIIAKAHMAEYISLNLNRLNNRRVKFDVVDISRIQNYEPRVKTMNVSVKSLRADSIISAVYGISRDEASAKIRRGNVKLNHQLISKAAYNASVGDLFSVRGKGRFIISEHSGLTKKGRNKLIVKKYL